MLHDSISMKHLGTGKLKETEYKLMAVESRGEKSSEGDCYGDRVSSVADSNVLELDGGDGCTTPAKHYMPLNRTF